MKAIDLFYKIYDWVREKLGMIHDPYIEIISFHGGMNRRVSPLLVKLEEARIAKNVNLDEIGTIQKAKGYTVIGNAPTTDNVLALYPFYKIDATTTRYFLRDSGGNVYKYNSGSDAWDAISGATGMSSTIIPVWITYKNLAMRFNGSDSPKKFDGTTFANLAGSPKNGSLAALYKDRVYAAGVSPNYSTVYYSETGNPENWPSFNNFDVNNNDGDRLMALEPIFDSLVLFKEFSIWEFQVDAKNNPSTLRYITLDVGTTSRRSIVNIGGIVYFFSRKGVYQFASRYPELISLKVQDFIDAIIDPYAVVAWKKGNKYHLFIGNVTVEGRTHNNCVLVYDTLQDTWSFRTLAHAVKSVADFIGSDNILKVYLGSSAGKTFEWEKGYKYDTSSIEIEYETGLIEPPVSENPDAEKEFRRIVVRSSNLPKSPATLHYSVDGKGFKELGKIKTTIQRFDFRERGSDIKFRIHEVSDKELREIYKIGIFYLDIGGELTKKR